MDWQPIDTAPKDGRPLLLMTEQGVRLGGWTMPIYFFGTPTPGWRSIPGEWNLLGVTRWLPAPLLPDLEAMRRECMTINGRSCAYPACDCTPRFLPERRSHGSERAQE
jgi:hypothetical protein